MSAPLRVLIACEFTGTVVRGLYASEEECARALGHTGRPDNRVHSMSPGADRSKERSRFFPSVARAMAEQWGGFALDMQEIAA